MDIDRVRYFQAFAQTGSLTKACEILHISQPALSKALKTLEAEVKLALVEADGRGLRLTAQGIRFRNETAPLLEQWLNLSQKIQTENIITSTRIGSFEVFTTYFLGKLLKNISLPCVEIYELIPASLKRHWLRRRLILE